MAVGFWYGETNGYYVGPQLSSSDDSVPERLESQSGYVLNSDKTAWIRGVSATIKAMTEYACTIAHAGYTYGDNTFNICDMASSSTGRDYMLNIFYAHNAINVSDSTYTGTTWRDVNDATVDFGTTAALDVFLTAALEWGRSMVKVRETYKAAITALTDEEAASYDFTADWPSSTYSSGE